MANIQYIFLILPKPFKILPKWQYFPNMVTLATDLNGCKTTAAKTLKGGKGGAKSEKNVRLISSEWMRTRE